MPTALITGANRGLGLEFVRQLLDAHWRVHACCRSPEAAKDLGVLAGASAGQVRVHQMDIADLEAVDRLAAELKGEAIDLLINNAGIIDPDGGSFSEGARTTLQQFGELNFAGWGDVFHVNVIGTTKVAEAFLENVASGERKTIVMISSVMGSITANSIHNFPPGGGVYLYRSSKAALNMVARNMAADLHARGIIVLSLNPGWVRTDMGGSDGMLDADVSIANLIKLINESTLETSGSFISQDGSQLPW